MSVRPRVTILCKSITHYRKPFLELLRERLVDEGIDLAVVYGDPSARESAKADTVDLSFGTYVRNRRFRFLGRELIWQPVFEQLKGADLVIVEQASKLLINYLLQSSYLFGIGPKFAYWGHGRNFQAHNASQFGELLKRLFATRVHWWFAYTQRSGDVIRALGFPDDRITTVQNAIDTRSLVLAKAALSDDRLNHLRSQLLLKGNNIAVFAGGLYHEKRLPFLVDACVRVRALVSDFEIIIIGAGAGAAVVEQASERYPWIKYVGPKFGDERVPYLSLGKLFLMPGLVGLAVLDAFALELPVVTTELSAHGPEIEYLRDGVNGVIVDDPDDRNAYATAVAHLLCCEADRARLVAGCRIASQRFTLEEMVDRFASGVMRAVRTT